MSYYPTARGRRMDLIYRCGRVAFMSTAAATEKMKEFYNKRQNDMRNKRFINGRIHALEGGGYFEER